jgi:hypothetical protein
MAVDKMVAAHVAKNLPAFLEACDKLMEQCLEYRMQHEANNIAKFLVAVENDDAWAMSEALVNITAPLTALGEALLQNEELFRGSVIASRLLVELADQSNPN